MAEIYLFLLDFLWFKKNKQNVSVFLKIQYQYDEDLSKPVILISCRKYSHKKCKVYFLFLHKLLCFGKLNVLLLTNEFTTPFVSSSFGLEIWI